MQSTDTVLMVTPDHFCFNSETGETNTFQHKEESENIAHDAKEDFERIKKRLSDEGVRVITLPSPTDPNTPDAVFPNNWFSVHYDAETTKTLLVLYPMLNENRRAERQVDTLKELLKENGIEINDTFDLTHFETDNKALEGTGSLVLDRVNKIAYASKSPRMNEEVLKEWCDHMNYTSVIFSSYDNNTLIYHTNVMMCVGTDFAVVCAEAITDEEERKSVLSSLEGNNKKIYEITIEQMNKFCGNMLEVKTTSGDTKLAMSTTACEAFTLTEYEQLEHYGPIVHANIGTIEKVGGGCVRCMLAEIFHG